MQRTCVDRLAMNLGSAVIAWRSEVLVAMKPSTGTMSFSKTWSMLGVLVIVGVAVPTMTAGVSLIAGTEWGS